MLTRDEMLAKNTFPPVNFDTKSDWGVVYLKTFNGVDASNWHSWASTQFDPETGQIGNVGLYRANLIQRTVCDETGKLIFEESDIPRILGIQAGLFAELFIASVSHNKLSVTEVAKERLGFTETKSNATGTG